MNSRAAPFAAGKVPVYHQSYASESYVFTCEMDIALTHALSRKASRRKLACEALKRCIVAGIRMMRPDLTANANELLAIVGA